jgi:ABC-type lipoprotein release transport system permease subunit
MLIYIQMSWRNVWRHRKRSAVVIVSIVVGLFAMISTIGIYNGINEQMLENQIASNIGHLSYQRKEYSGNYRAEMLFAEPVQLLAALGADKRVRSFAPRIRIEGMASGSGGARNVIITGIDPSRERALSSIADYTVTGERALRDNRAAGGEYLDDPLAKEVLISTDTAVKLDLMIGERMVLSFVDARGEIIREAFIVKGLFKSPIADYDRLFVFVPIRVMQNLLGAPGLVSEVTAALYQRDDAAPLRAALVSKRDDPQIPLFTWRELAPALVSAIATFNSMMYISFAIVFVTVIFTITNTLIMSVMERFHEIGVMKSIGTPPSAIFVTIIAESFFLGLLGLICGTAVGVIFLAVVGRGGIDFAWFSSAMELWGSGSIIYPILTINDFLAATGIVLQTSLVAALYPAVKAARIKPLDALQYL